MSIARHAAAAELLLADELFLIALDERTGGLVLGPQAAGLVLAGGLFGELLLRRIVAVDAGQVAVAAGGFMVPQDPVARRVLGRLMAEPQTVDLASWLAYFAQDGAEGLVSGRLAGLGWIRRVEHKRRRSAAGVVVYEPVDVNVVAYRGVRLSNVLKRGDLVRPGGEGLGAQYVWPDVALAALVNAAGLTKHVLWPEQQPGLDHLHAVLHRVNQVWPEVCELARHVEAAVGGVALSHAHRPGR